MVGAANPVFAHVRMKQFFSFVLDIIGQIATVLFDPISIFGLYHFDLITDIYFTIKLFCNCHYNYGIASLAIILTSYLTTFFHLVFFMEKDVIIALTYPYHHT